MIIYKKRRCPRFISYFEGSYLLPKQGKTRLELDFILVMRTKGQNKGKNISRNVNIFDPHTTGYFKQVLMMATMEDNE